MRKNKLIELLQGIKGNPEIVIWNGYVEDYQNIDTKLIPIQLYKSSKEAYATLLAMSASYTGRESKPEEIEEKCSRLAKTAEWEMGSSCCSNEEMRTLMLKDKRKTVVMLVPNPRGKKSHDRVGSITY